MSTTRQEKNSTQLVECHTQPNQPGQLEKAGKVITAGIVGGTFKTAVLYIPHKFSYFINTAANKTTWTEAAKFFYGQGAKFFYGLDAAITYSSLSYMVFFGFQINIRNVLTEKLPETTSQAQINTFAATAASVGTTFVVSPLAVWKQKRMLNCASHKELWNEFLMPPFSKSWRGGPAKIITDAINTGVIYASLEILNQIDKYLRGESDQPIITPSIAGAMAGFVGSLASNPFAVIVAKQRDTYESFLATFSKISHTRGLAGFYPKFLGISAINGVFNGIILNNLKCYLDSHFKTAPSARALQENKKIVPQNNPVNKSHYFDGIFKNAAKPKKKKNQPMLTLFSNNDLVKKTKVPAPAPEISVNKKSS